MLGNDDKHVIEKVFRLDERLRERGRFVLAQNENLVEKIPPLRKSPRARLEFIAVKGIFDIS